MGKNHKNARTERKTSIYPDQTENGVETTDSNTTYEREEAAEADTRNLMSAAQSDTTSEREEAVKSDEQTRVTIKSAFSSLFYLLENAAEEDKTVKEIRDEYLDLMKVKSNRESTLVLYDTNGKLVAARCWYNERWFALVGEHACPWPTKGNTKTGLNTMNKVGVSLWYKHYNKRNRDMKAVDTAVFAGSISVDERLTKHSECERIFQKRIAADRAAMAALTDEEAASNRVLAGWATSEEVQAQLESEDYSFEWSMARSDAESQHKQVKTNSVAVLLKNL